MLGIVWNTLPILTHFYIYGLILLFLFLNWEAGIEGEGTYGSKVASGTSQVQ